jgi:hypothetical protein
MTNKNILNYLFTLKDNFWETEIKSLGKEIILSVQDTLFQDSIIGSKISKITSDKNLEVITKKSIVTLTSLANQVYEVYGNVECDFKLVRIRLLNGNIIEYQFYLYLSNLDEGDNYGVWTAIFESDHITGIYRKQF